MKRSPLKRKTPLARAGSLKRAQLARTPVTPDGWAAPWPAGFKRRGLRRRRARAHDPAFAEQAERCRRKPCCVCAHLGERQQGRTVPHHDPSRGAGGLDRDTVPLCDLHHRAVHLEGRVSFWARVGLPIADVLARMREPDEGPPA
jgi:hypothetical protein